MNVNRSGYYKWVTRKDKPNRYEQDRILLTKLLKEKHEKYKTKGYHNLAKAIKIQTGWVFSDNLAHKCCKVEGIKSAVRRYRYRKVGEEHISFKNTVSGTPTDNPIIESLNGWMKEEMIINFGLKETNDIFEFINNYVFYFNNERTAYALDYKTPVQFKTDQGFA